MRKFLLNAWNMQCCRAVADRGAGGKLHFEQKLIRPYIGREIFVRKKPLRHIVNLLNFIMRKDSIN